jgi:predicted MPP superfamily phosphohydrolase
LGNHDYSFYLDADPVVKAANEREMVSRQRQFGWTVLLNENHSVERGKSRIVIAGEENDGEGRFPAKGNLDKALEGTDSTDFVIMLQHDPSAWRRSILPLSSTQLTLSGHTHGGQLSLFGLRPTQIVNTEDYGLYQSNGQRLLVTSGVGALLPFRFGVSPEIVVITLKCAQK